MAEQSEPERDLTPRENPIMSEPATPEACQQDYADGSDIRGRLGWTNGQN